MKKRISFVFLNLVLILFPSVVQGFSQDYEVGVQVGDWAEYDHLSGDGDYLYSIRRTIEAIDGTRVKIKWENLGDTTQVSSSWIDIKLDTWLEEWGKFTVLIAKDMEEEAKVYDDEDAPILGPSTSMEFAGAMREVSYLSIFESPYGGTSSYVIDLYYDKASGLMVNMTFNARGQWYIETITNTNLWTPDELPSENSSQSTYFLIVGGIGAIVIGGLLLYRNKRPPPPL
jgi:hypothetical protein